MLVAAQQGIFIEYFENSTNLALVNAKFRGISSSQAATSSDESKYTCDLDNELNYRMMTKNKRVFYMIWHPHSTSYEVITPSPFPLVIKKGSKNTNCPQAKYEYLS